MLARKIIISKEECVPGMTLMQSIVDEHTGSMILARGQMLTSDNIYRLNNFEHTHVWVEIESENALWKVSEAHQVAYEAYAKSLEYILTTSKEKVIPIETLHEMASSMIQQFQEEYDIVAVVQLMSQYDKNTFYHSVNVAFLSLLMGRWMDYSQERLQDLLVAALLHDMGKIEVALELLSKNEEQMELMEKLYYKRHTVLGYERLVREGIENKEILKGVLSHHERCDGSGYPLSLRDSKINDFAKIIGIADTYDRLREEVHIFEIIRRMGNVMLRQFDVQLLLPFCQNIANYYIGARVLLNTGDIGEVVFIQSQAMGRPIVKIQDDYINLYEKNHLEIEQVF